MEYLLVIETPNLQGGSPNGFVKTKNRPSLHLGKSNEEKQNSGIRQ